MRRLSIEPRRIAALAGLLLAGCAGVQRTPAEAIALPARGAVVSSAHGGRMRRVTS